MYGATPSRPSNVRLQARAASGASICKPLFGASQFEWDTHKAAFGQKLFNWLPFNAPAT
jgi:hypothetical protein